MADAPAPGKGQPKTARHRYRLTVGRELTADELKQLKSISDVHEVKKAGDEDHEHHEHSDHSGGGGGPDA